MIYEEGRLFLYRTISRSTLGSTVSMRRAIPISLKLVFQVSSKILVFCSMEPHPTCKPCLFQQSGSFSGL